MARVGGEWKNTGFVSNMKDKWTGSKVGKAFYGAPQHIEAVQDKLMAKYGNTTWAKNMDRVGAWSGSVANRFDIEAKVGKAGESSGQVGRRARRRDQAWQVDGLRGGTLGAQTRELAMKMQARDASHLEETRWKNAT